jgi:hypothetical protein
MAPNDADGTRGDEFFSDAQIERLHQLMGRWRAARESGVPFPPEEQAELDALVIAEVEAATARSQEMLNAQNTPE